MKIAIDISAVIYGTGVSVYTKNLVKNLLDIDPHNDYTFFGGSLRRSNEINSFLRSLKKNKFRKKIFTIPPTLADLIWNRLHILPIDLFIGKTGVFHSSDWTQPPTRAFKVTTLHDLTPVLYPALSHPRIVNAHRLRLGWIVKEVDRIIVPSQSTANDAEKLGIKASKIRIIPEATDPVFRDFEMKSEKMEAIKQKYGISGKYMLAVGVGPRKNTSRIISAVKALKEADIKLVVIGFPYFAATNDKNVIYANHIPQVDLPYIYSGSELLLYPSLHEGFGLPILEAFATGTPVVTSNRGSMAEIAINAAVLVDPEKTESIKAGILEALKNRNKLVKLGSNEAKKYSWRKNAQATLQVYEESGYR